jgi:hypothetical protein
MKTKTFILVAAIISAFSSQVYGRTMVATKSPLKLPEVLSKETVVSTNKPVFLRKGPTIQIAVLIDTSNSMDGLISQAKNQLWDIINETAKANKNDTPVFIEVSLIEYGKRSLAASSGYIRQIMPLTQDLDALSLNLFNLKTNGGDEYAGQAIHQAVDELAWSPHEDDLKFIVIAGNESFAQGEAVSYAYAIKQAVKNNIMINTVFCGDKQKGINLKWRDGAKRGGGVYLNINQDEQMVHIATPYDERINTLGKKLNKTYIGHGVYGDEKKAMQESVDALNASSSRTQLTKRTLSKASVNYDASSWDVVSSFKASGSAEKQRDIVDAAKKETAFHGMSDEEVRETIASLSKERVRIEKNIASLNLKREQYIYQQGASKKDTFGDKLVRSIKEASIKKGYVFPAHSSGRYQE